MGMTCCALFASTLAPVAFAGTAKGEKLEQQSQQMENKAQQQKSEGHPLRAGRDAKRAARKGARAERKLGNSGAQQPVQPVTMPAQ